MLEAAARSHCIAFVPRTVARDAVAAGRVRVLDTLDVATADLARRAVALLVDHALSMDP